MKINFLVLFFCIHCLFVFGCNNNKTDSEYELKKDILENLLSHTSPDLFYVADSCVLDYPLEFFPKAIGDISLTDSAIIVFGLDLNTEYPIVEFKKNGSFYRTVGRAGQGPGEIPLQTTKISAFKNKLAVASEGFNRLTIFENGKYLRDKSFNITQDSIQIKDVLIYDDNYILVHCNAFAQNNIIVLDENLNIVQKLFKVPPSTSLTSLIYYNIWGIQMDDKGNTVSHLGYPDIVLEVRRNNHEFEITNQLNSLNLSEYQLIHADITADAYTKGDKNPFELFQSISQINWIAPMGGLFVGVYGFWGDETNKKNAGINVREHNYQIFVAKKDGNILIEKPLLYQTKKRIIPHNNVIIEYFFYQSNGEIALKLNFLKLKSDKDKRR